MIHKQPVRWTHDRIVSCDGGGGPLGHPRIFINVDKPQICACTYCGLPFVCPPQNHRSGPIGCGMDKTDETQAHEHHRATLEAIPESQLAYPLAPKGNPAEVDVSQRISNEPLGQR